MTKRGQISTEVMYSIGIMVIIFLILTGISFNRRLELQNVNEFLDKQNQCFAISDYITTIAIGGEGTSAELYARYNTAILDSGVIIVGDNPSDVEAVEVTCGFAANVSVMPPSGLSEQRKYYFENKKGIVFITQ